MNMKISFNPTYNLNIGIKQNKINASKPQSNSKMQNLNGLKCISSYNIPFGTKAVYAINYDGSYEKYNSQTEAKTKYGHSVIPCLRGELYAFNSRVFVSADDIENAKGEIDTSKINRALLNFKYAHKQPLYSIDFNGNIQRFNNIKEAAEKTGVSISGIVLILLEEQKTLKGYTFLKAFDVELRDKNGKLLLDENDEPVVDMKKLIKAREKNLKAAKKFPIVSIDKNGTIKRYQNSNEIADELGCTLQKVINALTFDNVVRDNFIFMRLSDVVKIDEFGDVVYDENNDYQLDYAKINERIRGRFDK